MAATTAEQSEAQSSSSFPSTNHPIGNNDLKTVDETTPFVDYAVHQAQIYENALNDALHSTLEYSKLRISQIRSTSSAHFHQLLVFFS